MGRPGAGSGRPSMGTGSTHKVGGSAGSIHKVNVTSSRPTMSTASTMRPTMSISKPKMNTGSKPLSSSNTLRPQPDTKRVEAPRPKPKPTPTIDAGMMGMAQRSTNENYRNHDMRERERYEERRREERREHDRTAPLRSQTPVKQTTVINNTYVVNEHVNRREPYTVHGNPDAAVPSKKSVSYEHDKPRSPQRMGGLETEAIRGSALSKELDRRLNERKEAKLREENRRQFVRLGICAAVFVAIFLFVIALVFRQSSKNQESAYHREKLNTGAAFMNDCVNDELGWLDADKVSRGLHKFYDDTGAQPYIWLRKFDGELHDDSEELDIALRYFDDVVSRQDAIMYVYFETDDPTEIGNMAIIHGQVSGAIMDSEAEEIFWNYVDSDWSLYGEDETDEMFIDIFTRTGESIMYHPTNAYDVLNFVLIFCSIIILAGAAVVLVKEKNRRDKEKAEETERILKTSMSDLVGNEQDELLNKYK